MLDLFLRKSKQSSSSQNQSQESISIDSNQSANSATSSQSGNLVENNSSLIPRQQQSKSDNDGSVGKVSEILSTPVDLIIASSSITASSSSSFDNNNSFDNSIGKESSSRKKSFLMGALGRKNSGARSFSALPAIPSISTLTSSSSSQSSNNNNHGSSDTSPARSPLQNVVPTGGDGEGSSNESLEIAALSIPDKNNQQVSSSSKIEDVIPSPPNDTLMPLESGFSQSQSSLNDSIGGSSSSAPTKGRSKQSIDLGIFSAFSSSTNSLKSAEVGGGSPGAGSGGTLRRLVRRPESLISTGTMRFSRKIKDAFGFGEEDNSDANSMVSFSADQMSAHSADDEDNSSDDIFGISALLIPVQIFFRGGNVPRSFKINPRHRIEEFIQAFLENSCPEDTALLELYKADPTTLRVCKLEKNALLGRNWFASSDLVRQCKIRDGDELRVMSITDELHISYTCPPQRQLREKKFSFNDSVKAIIESIAQEHGLSSGQKYGLYVKQIGFWLDEQKTLVSYELLDTQILEFREEAKEFLLRVQVPDVSSKFTLKVLPSLSVADVMSMIDYNLRTRRISLIEKGLDDPYFFPFNNALLEVDRIDSGRKGTVFGLYQDSRQLWLDREKTLEEQSITNTFIDELQFKIHSHPITIALPSVMIHLYKGALLKSFDHDGQAYQTNWTQIRAFSETKVSDILDKFAEQNPLITSFSTASSSWALFTKGGEKIKEESLVWAVLQDSSNLEIFEYKLIPKKISVATTKERDVKVDIEADFSIPLRDLLPKFCRRFGIVLGNVNSVIFHGKSLDVSKSLYDNGFVESEPLLLEVDLSRSVKESNDQNINIWEETTDSIDKITFASDSDSQIVATASLNLDFLKTFLLTYKSFTTPLVLLKKIIERYQVPRHALSGSMSFSEYDKFRLKIQLRVCNVLQQWVKKYHYDFVDSSGHLVSTQGTHANKAILEKHTLLVKVLAFTEQTLIEDHPSLARQLRKFLLRLREGNIPQAASVTHAAAAPSSKFVEPPSGSNELGVLNVFSCDAEEIARQLTLIEFDLFSKIMPYEFLNQAWTKSDAVIRTPNIIAVTRRFNEIALWVVKSIVEVKTIRARVKRMTKLIDIAGYLYLQNNFSTLMAFIAGFNKAAVTRLKHTAKELSNKSTKKLIELESIMSAEGSYKNYRSQLHQVNPPCIPYIGVYLLDLTYMEDGNPNNINGLINFSKRRLINTLIREVQQYQDQPFNLKPVDMLVEALNSTIAMPVKEQYQDTPSFQSTQFPFDTVKAYEDHLFDMSLTREPRGAERSIVA